MMSLVVFLAPFVMIATVGSFSMFGPRYLCIGMEPCGMPGGCRAAAECLDIDPRELARITTENAIKFFQLS